MFPVKPLIALAALPACVTVSGPCSVTVQATDGGERSARLACEAKGSAAILAPARTIGVIVRGASEAAP
jgi:hypothetical protein